MNSDTLSPGAAVHFLQSGAPPPDLETYVLQGGFAHFAQLYHTEPSLFEDWDTELWQQVWTGQPPLAAVLTGTAPEPEPGLLGSGSGSFRRHKPRGSFHLPPTFVRMPPQQLYELLLCSERGVVLVDVRQTDFQGGHIADSQNIPLDRFMAHPFTTPKSMSPSSSLNSAWCVEAANGDHWGSAGVLPPRR